MNITVESTGIEAALAQMDPKRAEVALLLWYDRGTSYVKGELRSRAPARLRSKVKIITDGYKPPHWARVFVKSPLAHLIEGGTGRLGAAGFKHNTDFFPSVTGIMRSTGLEKPQAFLVARAIAEQGGTRPRPFIKPTFEATKGRLAQMAAEALDEAFR